MRARFNLNLCSEVLETTGGKTVFRYRFLRNHRGCLRMTDTFERLFQTIARIMRASDGSPRQSLVGNVGAPKGIFEVAANHSNHRRPSHRSITLYRLKEFCFQILKTLFQASSAHKQRRS